MTSTPAAAPVLPLPAADAVPAPVVPAVPAVPAGSLNVAALYRISMLVDALRDTARVMVPVGHADLGTVERTMRDRFNALRDAYLALQTDSDETAQWVPEPLLANALVSEIFDAAAALAGLLDVTLHTPAVVLNHKMAASKIAEVEKVLGRMPNVPNGTDTQVQAPGQYL